MNRTASTHWPVPSGVRVLDDVRRIEAIGLVGLSLLLVVEFGPTGMMLASFLLGSAVLVTPKERVATDASYDEKRMQFLNGLQAEAQAIRSQYLSARIKPLSQSRSQELWQARKEMLVWLDRSRSRLRKYPEFAAIYASRGCQGGLLYELDCSINCISELTRLSRLSKKLQLPI